MNLHLLRIFTAVVEQKSFSRAAEVQGVSQPAVSKAVRELEDQLQVVLLERGGRNFRPSEAGQMLYKYARGIFAMERAAIEAVQAYSELERGCLTIGATASIALHHLPRDLADFARQYPGIELRVLTGNTRQIAQWLLDCDVDVALVEADIDDERLEARPWRRERMVVIGAPGLLPAGRSFSGEELSAWPWIVREPGSGSRSVTEKEFARLEIKPARALEAGGNELIVALVAAGLGLGLVPETVAADALAQDKVRCIELSGGELSRELFRLRLPRRPVSQSALAFEALIG